MSKYFRFAGLHFEDFKIVVSGLSNEVAAKIIGVGINKNALPQLRSARLDFCVRRMKPPMFEPVVGRPLRRELAHVFALVEEPAPRYGIKTSSTLMTVSLRQEGSLLAAMLACVAEF